VKTGDGRTDGSGGLPQRDENVIRLPRDWLGPPEELVPIGSAARARAAQRDPEADIPQAADAFWSEDSAALHDALEAPDPGICERPTPPVGLVSPVAGLGPHRAIRLPHLGALRAGGPPRWRWSLLGVAVVVLTVVAVIGTSEGPVPHRIPGHIRVSHTAASSGLIASTDAGGVAAGVAVAVAAEKAAAGRRPRALSRRQSTSRAAPSRRQSMSRARTRARAGGRHPVKAYHRAVPTHSAASSPSTVTHATTSSPPTQSRTPSASTASAVASTGSRPATGAAGPTQLGSMTGGCLPKCK
jgi:hypothetical protein